MDLSLINNIDCSSYLINHGNFHIFVESFARVNTLSLTGKLLLPIANRFIVQWKEALDVEFLGKNKRLGSYWNCEYVGIVI